MATFDNTQYQALLDDPSEKLDAEYKQWLDLSNEEVRANIARHICALANNGGGYIVFGLTDLMQFAGPNPFPTPSCDRDLISSIVKKYLEPTRAIDARVHDRPTH